MYKKQKGFTLVEMMIVTAIIGILAGTVMTVINIPRTQARARDGRRVADLMSIQNALALYFSNNRAYPRSDTWQPFTGSIINGVDTDGLVYMNNVPQDPRGGSSGVACFGGELNPYGYYYRSTSDGTYILGTIMELDTAIDAASVCSAVCPLDYGCSATVNTCYCIQNPM